MSRSAARRFQRERLAAGIVEPQPMPIVERVFGLQNSPTYRSELTQAYIEDAFQRSRLPPKKRDPRWAFHPETKSKDDSTAPATPKRDAYELMFAE